MGLINSILTWIMKKRIHQMELFMKYPHEVQEEWLFKLVRTARDTEFGKAHGFSSITNYQKFAEQVPVQTYEQLYPYIDRMMRGEQNILWPSEIRWFSKSSGTTNARSKFIPVSSEALEECHFKGGKDLLAIYVHNHPDTHIFDGKNLAVGGSHQLNENDPTASSYYGDVSAVIMQNLPFWAEYIRTPRLETALMGNWEEKIERLAQETLKENVTSIAGVPTWTVLLLQRITELAGARSITDVWPGLEVFFHGAVSFVPYRDVFAQLIPSPHMRYWEVYNASEGFFGIQDRSRANDMLLMLDYGIFYEFIPLEELGRETPHTVPLGEVELNRNYAMVISTNSGLWRYLIGDTVRFTSLSPYRIRITGRTKHFINAFGEELVVENADAAIARACALTGARIDNYTAAPVYMDVHGKGAHEWIVEFTTEPPDLHEFARHLDDALRQLNSDYDAKRTHNLALQPPIVHAVKPGTFYNWMKRRGKLGGQHKVPRLSNTREYVDDLLRMEHS